MKFFPTGSASPKKSFPQILAGLITSHFHDRLKNTSGSSDRIVVSDTTPVRISSASVTIPSKWTYAQFDRNLDLGDRITLQGTAQQFSVWNNIYINAAGEQRRYLNAFGPAMLAFSAVQQYFAWYNYPSAAAADDGLIGTPSASLMSSVNGLIIPGPNGGIGGYTSSRERLDLRSATALNTFIRFLNPTTGTGASDGWNFGLIADSADMLLRCLEAAGNWRIRDSANADLATWDFAKKILALGQAAASQKFTGNSQGLSFNSRHFKGSWGTDLFEMSGIYRLNSGECRSVAPGLNATMISQSDSGIDLYMANSLTGAIDAVVQMVSAIKLYQDNSANQKRVLVNIDYSDIDFEVYGTTKRVLMVDASEDSALNGGSTVNANTSKFPTHSTTLAGAMYICTPATPIDVRRVRVLRLNPAMGANWYRFTNAVNGQEIIVENLGQVDANIDNDSQSDLEKIIVPPKKIAFLIYDAFEAGGQGRWLNLDPGSTIYAPYYHNHSGAYLEPTSLAFHPQSATNGFSSKTVGYDYVSYKVVDGIIHLWFDIRGVSDSTAKWIQLPVAPAITTFANINCVDNGVETRGDILLGIQQGNLFANCDKVGNWTSSGNIQIFGQASYPIN